MILILDTTGHIIYKAKTRKEALEYISIKGRYDWRIV